MGEKRLGGGITSKRANEAGEAIPDDHRYDSLRRHEEEMSATNERPSSTAADRLDSSDVAVPNPGHNRPNTDLRPDEAMNQDQQSRTNVDPTADRM
jgi:hypothetical protein